MVDHLQSRVTPWRQYTSHVKVRGTLSKMEVSAQYLKCTCIELFDNLFANTEDRNEKKAVHRLLTSVSVPEI